MIERLIEMDTNTTASYSWPNLAVKPLGVTCSVRSVLDHKLAILSFQKRLDQSFSM